MSAPLHWRVGDRCSFAFGTERLIGRIVAEDDYGYLEVAVSEQEGRFLIPRRAAELVPLPLREVTL